ncbi:hypothetical protein BHM03_00032138 [Ensete ventricosum]|nr:hypothetical protein BHM03_00032138 [Ensete ventricosum]
MEVTSSLTRWILSNLHLFSLQVEVGLIAASSSPSTTWIASTLAFAFATYRDLHPTIVESFYLLVSIDPFVTQREIVLELTRHLGERQEL